MWLLTKIFLFICLLQNMLFWPTRLYGSQWIVSLIPLALLLCFRRHWNVRYPYLGLLLIIFVLTAYSMFINSFQLSMSFLFLYLIGYCMFTLKESRKRDLLSSVTNWLGIIIAISLCFYIVWLFIDFKQFGTLKWEAYGQDYQPYRNFYLFIMPTYGVIIPRFSGPFIEPGHLGLVASLFLFANKFDFKRNPILWAHLAGLLFSLSLAGYVMLAIGYFMIKSSSNKQILLVAGVFAAAYFGVTQFWNGGDNPVNDTIIERLEYDENKGIKGNNRNLYSTDKVYSKMVEDGSIVFGMGEKEYGELNKKGMVGGAGYTIYAMFHGIVGIIIIFFYYAYMSWNAKNRIFALKFLFLIAACFMQRAYPQWIAWLLPFTTSLTLRNLRCSNDYSRANRRVAARYTKTLLNED